MKNKKYKKSLFIFRRDLRLSDNTGLLNALESSEKVMCCFMFDPGQVDNNVYKSEKCVQFMAGSLIQLDKSLKNVNAKLYFFKGHPHKIVGKVVKEKEIEAVFMNRDYTPFSKKRDSLIQKTCKRLDVDYHLSADYLLHEPEEIMNNNGEPYKVFTYFYRTASSMPVLKPQKNNYKNYYRPLISFDDPDLVKRYRKKDVKLRIKSGRSEALKILRNIDEFEDYKEKKDYPAKDTTHLSPHLKFGTCSVREAYEAINNKLKNKKELIRQLYWRDFYTHIVFHFPKVFGEPFYEKYKQVPWSKSKKMFKAWCEGKTGFPIVDAGMRELNATGYMHNRVRMITASFLTKDMHIDWRKGEKYFANKLQDYDASVNNGNWQWSASTGCDAQPYFRVFNPWLQQKKYDKNCEYIKKWLPELKDLEPKQIHNLYTQEDKPKNYPKPVLDHSSEAEESKKLYKEAVSEKRSSR